MSLSVKALFLSLLNGMKIQYNFSRRRQKKVFFKCTAAAMTLREMMIQK
jgi:hypothetical protein